MRLIKANLLFWIEVLIAFVGMFFFGMLKRNELTATTILVAIFIFEPMMLILETAILEALEKCIGFLSFFVCLVLQCMKQYLICMIPFGIMYAIYYSIRDHFHSESFEDIAICIIIVFGFFIPYNIYAYIKASNADIL